MENHCNELIIKTLPHAQNIEMPSYATFGSACMDIRAALKEDFLLKAGERFLCPTGLVFVIKEGFEVQIRPRSGMALKHGITVLNSPGTIDSDYRGEVHIMLINLSKLDFIITPSMRVAQFLLAKCEKFQLKLSNDISDTNRGAGGFGSTGY
ncbi:MAG: dUTP diphosphatase [Rickettsia sp.]|nr:dUTP diphosphatase [Rickettsia sp.]